jgi:DNA replication and repair protein RecF
MYASRLRLANFRNYQWQDLSFRDTSNLILGPNGQGKTNLLEALYLMATSRSQRTGRDEEMIGWEADAASILTEVKRERRPDITLEVHLHRAEDKSVRLNGVPRPRVLEILGEFNLVAVWVEDIDIVRGDPSVRRRFLNAEISQVSPEYCFQLGRYRRVLEHRNRLLKQLSQKGVSRDSLQVWSEELVKYGSPLIARRRAFVDQLSPPAGEVHAMLTDGEESLNLDYRPSLDIPEDANLEEAFARHLDELREEEIRRGLTLIGPHRDELAFLIDTRDARTYGSLGQQRTVALSLRLAELSAVRDQIGEPPVIIMDDVFAELDARRIRHLLEIALPGRQSFLVTTEAERLPADLVAGCDRFLVRRGVVEELQ